MKNITIYLRVFMKLSDILAIKNFYHNEKKYKMISFFNFIYILLYKGKICNKFYWQEIFSNYMSKNNFPEKLENLKKSFHDQISLEYIDRFVKNSQSWDSYHYSEDKFWTAYDKKLFQEFSKKEFVQPYPELVSINSFMFHSLYGLKDLPAEKLSSINGKTIIDAGGYLGDTLYLFHTAFNQSPIYIYEPLKQFTLTIDKLAKKFNSNLIHIKNFGLGVKSESISIEFENVHEQCSIVPLDDEKIDNIGLIKLDTEGFETKIILGAKEIIKKNKPVLLIAIYHTPEDFFELKDILLSLNPDYKFMIRRSEPILPSADLVLIAY